MGNLNGLWPCTALLQLVFKWLPQHKVDNLSSWAEGKGRQEVFGNDGSSVETFIRNRGFPIALSTVSGLT